MSAAKLVSPDGKVAHVIQEAMVVVGRSKGADFRIDHPSVSSRHCQISRVNDYYAIHDLGSRNGTRVNGSRISQAYLSAGDHIQIGEVVLKFEIEGEHKTTPPTFREASGGQVEDGLIVAMQRVTVAAESAHYYRHTDLVAQLGGEMARELSLDDADVRALRLATAMMDTGMLQIPSSILKRKGPLTEAERAEIEKHPIYSVEAVADLSFPDAAKQAIRGHHERWDGKGYPDKLAKEKIPFLARVLAISQATAAMLSNRPFKDRSPVAEVVGELKKGANAQFDPKLVPPMIKVVERVAKG